MVFEPSMILEDSPDSDMSGVFFHTLQAHRNNKICDEAVADLVSRRAGFKDQSLAISLSQRTGDPWGP